MDMERQENRTISVTFVTATFCFAFGQLAIGGLDGKIFKYDVNAGM